jgi:hypothetical protein
MRIALLSVIAFGLIGAAPGRDQALKIMHERHEGMEMIGKTTKAINREHSGASPNLATLRL